MSILYSRPIFTSLDSGISVHGCLCFFKTLLAWARTQSDVFISSMDMGSVGVAMGV